MKRSTCTLKLNKISRFKMVTEKIDEFVIFHQNFDRSVQLSSSFGETFSYVRGACKYKIKVYQADSYRKNNTCTSCVLNGFKYIFIHINYW